MTELNTPSGCSPCMFVMGMFAGYIASTILNALGNATPHDENAPPKSISLSTEEEIDDEGNVVRAPVANGGGTTTDDSKAPSNEEGAVSRPQSAPPTKTIHTSAASSDHGTVKLVEELAAPRPQSAPLTNAIHTSAASSDHGAVKLVIQRFRSASLLLSPGEAVQINKSQDQAEATCGMLVYVSFSRAAETNRSAIFTAARTVLNLSVLTRGVWGDGSGTVSALELATELNEAKGSASSASRSGVPILLVPQANLISKVKNNGKSIQYHSQVAKAVGKELFDTFVRSVQLIAYEHQCLARGEEISASLRKAFADVGGSTSDTSSGKSSGKQAIDPSVPPQNMFRDSTLYEGWDDDGIPIAKVGGEKPTKSAIKKMKKQQLAQQKRYEKYLASGSTAKGDGVDTSNYNDKDGEDIVEKLDDGFVRVVAGTFGNLQALSLDAGNGPFCHLVTIGY